MIQMASLGKVHLLLPLLFLSCIFCILLWVLLWRFLCVYHQAQSNRRGAAERNHPLLPPSPPNKKNEKTDDCPSPPLRTLIVLGSGGHTTEILYMTQHLNANHTNNHPPLFDPIFYCQADTDTTSADRLASQASSSHSPTYSSHIYNIPRSREVGQSYLTSLYTTLVAILYSFRLVYQLRPHVILCNGPGTCIPLCLVAFLYRALGILPNARTYIVFIESFCRVETLSLTGRILYPIADVFMLHWEELQQKYPQSIRTHSFLPKQPSEEQTTTEETKEKKAK